MRSLSKKAFLFSFVLIGFSGLAFSNAQLSPEKAPLVAEAKPAPAKKPLTTQKSEKKVERISPKEVSKHLEKSNPFSSSEKDRYVVNYTNVDVKEVIRFVGKVANLNFSYDPNELNFAITMVSEGPAHISDILSTLVQTLRIHGLSLVPGKDMLLICAEGKVKGAAPLVDNFESIGAFAKTPLVARAFMLENILPSAALALIQPMISPSALAEASDETHYLIVTDTPTNITQLEKYLELLNHPHEPYEISIFRAQNHFASALATLTQKVMESMAGKTPLMLLPQQNANAILIISTPFLTEKSLSILEKLDEEPVQTKSLPKNLEHENVFLYTPKFRGGKELIEALSTIEKTVKGSGFLNQDLIQTIESSRWISETGSIVFLGDKNALTKLTELLTTMDIDTSKMAAAPSFLVYVPQFLSYPDLKSALEHVTLALTGSDQASTDVALALKSAKYSSATGTLTFTGSRESLAQITATLGQLDNKESVTRLERQFFLYRPQYKKPKELLQTLKEVASGLKSSKILDTAVIESIQCAKLIIDTQGVLFTGSEQILSEIKALLKNIDAQFSGTSHISNFGEGSYLIYSIKYVSEQNLMSSLDQIASKLDSGPYPDEELIRSLKHTKYIQQTHSFIFAGDEVTLREISEMLTKLDTEANATNNPTEFLVYRPHYLQGKELLSELDTLESSLKRSGLHNPALLSSIQSATWSAKSGSLILSGSKPVIEDIEQMLKSIDSPNAGLNHEIFIYKVEHVPPRELLHNLKEASEQLSGEDEKLILDAVESAKVFKNTNSISFSGSQYTTTKLKSMLKELDITSNYAKGTTVFIYHPKNQTHYELDSSLKNIIDRLEKENTGQDLVYLVESREWDSTSSSYIFTGSTAAIEKLKALLVQVDVPSTSAQGVEVYTLKNISAADAESYLKELETNLKKGKNVDEDVVYVLEHAQVAGHSHSIILRGKKAAIAHVQALLTQFDTEKNAGSPAAHSTAFLTYRPKYMPGKDLVDHLHKMSDDLKQSGLVDRTMLSTLSKSKWNASSGSVLVTGSPESIKQVKEMIAQLDTPEKIGPQDGNSSFLIYTPEYVSAEDLEEWLKNTQQNLKHTGLSDAALFKVLSSMHLAENRKSLTFSGPPEGINKLKELIRNFDNASKGSVTGHDANNLTFLIYKLQYHQGTEIMQALQAIGLQFKKFEQNDAEQSKNDRDKPQVDSSLVNAIASMQWLQMTNSILCSGTPATLDKIKALIRKLDMPLRQVFLEVLIINTSLTDSLSFGLRWGGAGKLHNRLSTSLGLFPTISDTGYQQASNLNNLGTTIQNSVAGSLPTAATAFGSPGGFDFGVIGDIISHGSNVYLSLGSLASALQTDRNSTVILNPKIIAQDNQVAHMFSGSNRPFSVSTFTQTTTGGNSTDTTNTNDYRDVGFDLKITPILGANDVITLIIEQDFSELDFPTGIDTNETIQNNTISKQTTQTRVHVPNEHFIAISGMLRDTRARSKVGIPCLGGLPVIGAAFAQNQKTNQKTNTIIFIRPQIVTTDEQLVRMTEQQEDVFREQAKALELQYDIDDAIDMVVPIDELE